MPALIIGELADQQIPLAFQPATIAGHGLDLVFNIVANAPRGNVVASS